VCGINGIWFFEQKSSVGQASINKMNNAIAHRGPDSDGVFNIDNLFLGHRRLSIIDLSDAGKQPLIHKNLSLVFNGEIYNYLELKNELKNDFNFVSSSDTEVLLAAYKKWGQNMLHKLRGMFAFAIYNSENQQLFIARDRFGIKPLYYYFKDNKLIFSSEIRALLKSDLIEKKLNKQVLGQYLRYQTVQAPDTFIEDVKMLLPGHYLNITLEDFKESNWYNPVQAALNKPSVANRNQALKLVAEGLNLALEDRLIADVPVGAFLSGGIDSSLLVGLAAKLYDKKLETFHISFAEKEFSEAKYAKIIADKFGTNHHDIQLSPNYFLENLNAGMQALDFPSADGLNTYMVSKAAVKTGIKVTLSGLGGDEIFAGYDIFKRAVSLRNKKWLASFPVSARVMAGNLLKALKPSIKSDKIAEILSQDYFDVEYLYRFNREVLNLEIVKKLLVEPSAHSTNENVYKQIGSLVAFGELGYNLPITGKVSIAEITTYLQNILLRDTDQMSMAHALEVRVPFLDHRLVETVLPLPDTWKISPEKNKSLLIDAFPGLLPEVIFNRPKQGFTLPYEHWLKNELLSFCKSNLQYLGTLPYFNANEIEKLHKQFLKGDPKITWSRIWHLVVLANWIKTNELN